MEKMDVNIIELLEYLQDLVENSAKVPITGKVVIDKKEVIDVIEQIVHYLPDQFKKAQWVVNERERILQEASVELETARKETAELMRKNIENHDYVKEAKVRSQEIIAQAQREAKSIRLGARDYADEILSDLDKQVEIKKEALMNELKASVETFAQGLDGTLQNVGGTIKENIKELRSMK
ncbi:ATPase [Clostridium sp. 'White wine YQ']|uniref:ATPase n=1 Tax=Clostridium sp. 'White wine YQ' TaxID=3027474 RepID=UPI00236601A4|nr:ATPase [Clostridium sp. 'White wine YQ']MDD7793755.1 ATPase [Clostridium sp. 'White wine YQ']